MIMTDKIEDNDDFDIYADLEDKNDNNFEDSNDLVGCDSSQTQNKCFENNKKLSETFSTENNNNNNNNNSKEENDLILSELSILEKSLANTDNQNKELFKLNQQLREELAKKDKQLFILRTNISSLYKTAKAEIERKKREISELRESYDLIVFKRLNNRSDNSFHDNIGRNNSTDSRTNDEKVGKNLDSSVKEFCDKSTNTSHGYISHGSGLDHYKKNDNDYKNSSNGYTALKSRHSRRSRSRSRSRTRHRNSGERDRKRETEDRERRRSNSRKRHKCDKH